MKKKDNRNKRKNVGYVIIGFLFMICSILLLGVVLYIDILPIKYLSILIGVLLLLNVVINFFLFRRKIKKKPKKVFAALAIILSILFLGAAFFAFKTFAVMDNMTQKYKVYTYHVLVKNDSNYQKINDIEDKSLGYYNNNSKATKIAIAKLSEKVKTKNDSYGNLDSIGAALLNGEVESILLEDSQKTKLDNASGMVAGFANNSRVIYTFKVKVKIEEVNIDVTKDVFSIYISGMDEYGKVRETSRSDVNMIITINPKTKQILLTNIPRDYYVQLHDTTGNKDKLTHAGIYGVDTSVETLEDLLGIDISYYFKVNFSSLVNIIDALGGVDVYSEYDFQTRSWKGYQYNFKKGYNTVNGKEALYFVRERYAFQDGDNQRGKNQQAMIEAIFRKCTSPGIITKYNSLLNSLEDSMITDMPMKSITKLAKMQLKDNAKWTITSNSLTGTGDSDYTYSFPSQPLYVMVPDEESVKTAKELIAKVTNGEKLQSSYGGDSSNVHSVTKTEGYSAPAYSTSTQSSKTIKKTSSTTKKSTSTTKKKSSSQSSTSTKQQKTSTKAVEPAKKEEQQKVPDENVPVESVVPENSGDSDSGQNSNGE